MSMEFSALYAKTCVVRGYSLSQRMATLERDHYERNPTMKSLVLGLPMPLVLREQERTGSYKVISPSIVSDEKKAVFWLRKLKS